MLTVAPCRLEGRRRIWRSTTNFTHCVLECSSLNARRKFAPKLREMRNIAPTLNLTDRWFNHNRYLMRLYKWVYQTIWLFTCPLCKFHFVPNLWIDDRWLKLYFTRFQREFWTHGSALETDVDIWLPDERIKRFALLHALLDASRQSLAIPSVSASITQLFKST